ncbi:transposon protein [Striga asiatica]|uniref:Transposon protein n=1 Tax=Striga asiatica TaxID=4170 RepID=A0A5A7PX04_STRAF|nr:transposon protein [Striga asiatica]
MEIYIELRDEGQYVPTSNNETSESGDDSEMSDKTHNEGGDKIVDKGDKVSDRSDDGDNSDFGIRSKSSGRSDDADFDHNVDKYVDLGSEPDSDSGEEDLVEAPLDFQEYCSYNETISQMETAFNPVNICDPTVSLEMFSGTREEFNKGVQSHATKSKKSVKLKNNGNIRVHVVCDSKGLLSEGYLSKSQADPKRKVTTLEVLDGNPDSHYEKLWDYAQQLKDTNPGSTVILDVEEDDGAPRFSKFNVNSTGWWVSLDWTPQGVDPNNNIYPLAYVLVSREARDT